MRERKPTQRLTLYNCLCPELLRGFRLAALLAALRPGKPPVVFLGRITDLGILSLTKSLENRGNLCRINAAKIGGDFGVGAFLRAVGSVKETLNGFLVLPRDILGAAVLYLLLRLHRHLIVCDAKQRKAVIPHHLISLSNSRGCEVAVLQNLKQSLIVVLCETFSNSLRKGSAKHCLPLFISQIGELLKQSDNFHPLSLSLEVGNGRNARNIDLFHDLSISIE